MPNINMMCAGAVFGRIRISPEEYDVCLILGNNSGYLGTNMTRNASPAVDVYKILFFHPEYVFDVLS